MYNWLLILSITFISTTMLMFLSAFIAITDKASQYYNISKQELLYFYNSFNVFYLIISPFLFAIYKKYYYQIVCGSAILNTIGCVGRYFAGNDFHTALFMTAIVGVAHVPIITAPYGLLKLFNSQNQGYAAAIPLFLPVLGINYIIFHGMSFIIPSEGFQSFVGMNQMIAILSVIPAVSTLYLMKKLKNQILEINRQQSKQQTSICQAIKFQCTRIKSMMVYFIGWGTILGINWTYGGMFSYFLKPTMLSDEQIAMIGFWANISSVFFSNLGNWIANNSHCSNTMIIFCLNLIGFFASIVIQASTAIVHPLLQNEYTIIIAIVILRAGLSAFVNLSLVQLEKSGISSVLSSLIFFYIANIVNLGGNSLTGLVEGSNSLTIMTLVIWTCIFIVHLRQCTQDRKIGHEIQAVQTMDEQHKSETERSTLHFDESQEINMEQQ